MRVLGLLILMFVSFIVYVGDGILKCRINIVLFLSSGSYSIFEFICLSGEDIWSFEKWVVIVWLNYMCKDFLDMF